MLHALLEVSIKFCSDMRPFLVEDKVQNTKFEGRGGCRKSWTSVSLNGLLDPSCVRSSSATSRPPLAADSFREESCAGVRFKVINNATCLTLFMETGCSLIASLYGYNVSRLTRYNRYNTPRFQF